MHKVKLVLSFLRMPGSGKRCTSEGKKRNEYFFEKLQSALKHGRRVQRKYVGFFDQNQRVEGLDANRMSVQVRHGLKRRHPVVKQGTKVRHGGRLNPPRHSGILKRVWDGWRKVTRR